MDTIYFITALTLGLLLFLAVARALDYILNPLARYIGVEHWDDSFTPFSGIVTIIFILLGLTAATLPFIVLAGLTNFVRQFG